MRRKRAENGKPERFEDIDLWPIVIRENIQDTPHAPDALMAYAKRCGGPSMVKFCWRQWPKLQELVARSWKVEKVEEHIEKVGRSRIDILRDALVAPCICQGRWLTFARDL